MDHSRFLFIIKGEIADNIHSFQREGRYTRIIYDSGKDYPYNRENVRILSNPKKLDLDNYEYYSTIQKINLYNIKFALEFVDGGNFNHYYRFFFKNGTFRSYYQKQYNVPLVKTQMKKIIVTAKTLYSHPKNVSKIYAALHTDLAW